MRKNISKNPIHDNALRAFFLTVHQCVYFICLWGFLGALGYAETANFSDRKKILSGLLCDCSLQRKRIHQATQLQKQVGMKFKGLSVDAMPLSQRAPHQCKLPNKKARIQRAF
jgi:hypothetical protein